MPICGAEAGRSGQKTLFTIALHLAVRSWRIGYAGRVGIILILTGQALGIGSMLLSSVTNTIHLGELTLD